MGFRSRPAGKYAELAVTAAYAGAVGIRRPLPPGPVRRVAMTCEPLDAAAVAASVRDDRAGAVVVFEGVTREVPRLEYEAYETMALERLRAIADEEAASHGLCAIAVEHRTGTVPLGEPSVIVAVSAPHRREAFAGARAVIDRVKSEAPIWKVEMAAEGARRVRGTLPTA
jgi:molybdopterin synthase catalytic subunit